MSRFTIQQQRGRAGRWRSVAFLGVVGPTTYPEAVLAALTSTGPHRAARILDGTGREVRTFRYADRARLLEPVRRAVARAWKHRPPGGLYEDSCSRTQKRSARPRRPRDAAQFMEASA